MMTGLHTWMLMLALLVALTVTPSCQQIPMEMYEKLGNITSAREMMEKMLMKRNNTQHDDPLFTRPGALDPVVADIVAGSVAVADVCSPKVTSVEIPKDADRNVCFFPNCVAMQQCGGCGCGHAMLECAPIEERITDVQVMKMRYPFPGASKFTFEGLVTMGVEEHIKCACRCKVQPHHCHPHRHEYEEHSCRCTCKNHNDAISCPSHQMWSNDECACVCPKRHWCLEGESFSNTTCRCEMGSSFVKIIDQEEVTFQSHQEPETGPCKGARCRPGYRPIVVGEICHCRISHVSGVQSRRIGGHVALQPVENDRDKWERVPGHPQFHHVATTSTQSLRRRPRKPSRQTGSMLPTR